MEMFLAGFLMGGGIIAVILGQYIVRMARAMEPPADVVWQSLPMTDA